jgi:SAM-dependent methyltransferase
VIGLGYADERIFPIELLSTGCNSLPSVAWNRNEWNDLHDWTLEGDEWSDMADYCLQPYSEWKTSLIETFISPYLSGEKDVLEIAPGFGRWTVAMVERARSLTLVDLSPRCIETCRDRFGHYPQVRFLVNDGRSLSGVEDASIDFLVSIDSFVHMESDVVEAYIVEFARVLRPGGRAIIHHADKRAWSLRLVPLTRRMGLPGRLLQQLAGQGRLRDDGNRGAVSRSQVARSALRAGLTVEFQRSTWGDRHQFNVDKYRDCITGMLR